MKNKYIVRSRISEAKFREILKYFTEDIEASKISNLTKISEVTLCKIFREIRILMSKECEKISKFSGEISSPPRSFALYKPACSTASLVLKLMKATSDLKG